jgi:hypothetical protein
VCSCGPDGHPPCARPMCAWVTRCTAVWNRSKSARQIMDEPCGNLESAGTSGYDGVERW